MSEWLKEGCDLLKACFVLSEGKSCSIYLKKLKPAGGTLCSVGWILCSRYLERLRPAEGMIFFGRKNVSKFERRCDLLKPCFVVSDGRSCRSD